MIYRDEEELDDFDKRYILVAVIITIALFIALMITALYGLGELIRALAAL